MAFEGAAAPLHPLMQIVANLREEAFTLKRAGHPEEAQYREELARQLANAGEDLWTFIDEPAAMLKSGLEARTLRFRFRWLKECGLARYGPRRQRQYLAVAVPQRADTTAAYEAGRQGE
jgi:hypothetical protein